MKREPCVWNEGKCKSPLWTCREDSTSWSQMSGSSRSQVDSKSLCSKAFRLDCDMQYVWHIRAVSIVRLCSQPNIWDTHGNREAKHYCGDTWLVRWTKPEDCSLWPSTKRFGSTACVLWEYDCITGGSPVVCFQFAKTLLWGWSGTPLLNMANG